MIYIGGFKLDGTAVDNPDRMTVYKVKDVIVLEFINNLVLPLRIRVNPDSTCSLYYRERRVLRVALADTMRVRLRGGLTASDVDFELSDGTSNSVNIRVSAFDGVSISPQSKVVFPPSQVEKWMELTGVVKPDGCAVWVGEYICTTGYKVEIKPAVFILGFPNGFTFPIERFPDGVKIVDSKIIFGLAGPSGLFMRASKCTSDCVVFTVRFVVGGRIVVVRDIVYTKDYAEYDGKRVKSSIITKKLFLLEGRYYDGAW